MGSSVAYERLIATIKKFARECASQTSHEKAFQAWLAHFLMLEYGFRHVHTEIHILCETLRTQVPIAPCGDGEDVLSRKAVNIDISLTNGANLDTRKHTTRSQKLRNPAEFLAEFAAMIELKMLTNKSGSRSDPFVEIRKDLERLAILGQISPNLELVQVIVETIDDDHRLVCTGSRIEEMYAQVRRWGTGIRLPYIVVCRKNGESSVFQGDV